MVLITYIGLKTVHEEYDITNPDNLKLMNDKVMDEVLSPTDMISIDVEALSQDIELILRGYLNPYPKGKYISGLPEALSDYEAAKLITSGCEILDTPNYAYNGMVIIVALIENTIMMHHGSRELLYNSPVMGSSHMVFGDYIYNGDLFEEEVIATFIREGLVDRAEKPIRKVAAIVNPALEIVANFVKRQKHHVYNVSHNTSQVIVTRTMDIRAFRFNAFLKMQAEIERGHYEL